MPTKTRIVASGPDDRSVRLADGQVEQVPEGWELLPPGDAALTRRVKAGGPSGTVQEKKGWAYPTVGTYPCTVSTDCATTSCGAHWFAGTDSRTDASPSSTWLDRGSCFR